MFEIDGRRFATKFVLREAATEYSTTYNCRDEFRAKVFLNPNLSQLNKKIADLSRIADVRIPVPRHLVTRSRKPIGYAGPWVSGRPLSDLLDWNLRKTLGGSPKDIYNLVRQIQEIVSHVHAADCLIVNIHEHAFVFDENLTPYLQTFDEFESLRSLAPSPFITILDPSLKGRFNRGSDWFAFAVLAFTLFVGSHPFQGSHPYLLKIRERMSHRSSAYDPKTILPKGRSLDTIPPLYREWLKGIFTSEHRLPPPQDEIPFEISVPARLEHKPGVFKVEMVEEFDHTIINCLFHKNFQIVQFADFILLDGRKIETNGKVYVIAEPYPLCLKAENLGRYTRFRDLLDNSPRFDIPGQVFPNAGRLYSKRHHVLYGVEINYSECRSFASRLKKYRFQGPSSIFDDVAFDILKNNITRAIILSESAIFQLPEISGQQLIRAKHDNRVLMVLTRVGETYYRHIFRFNLGYENYAHRVIYDVPASTSLNFVTIGSICFSLNESCGLEIFSRKPISSEVKFLNDRFLMPDMILVNRNDEPHIIYGRKIYRMLIPDVPS